MPIREEREWGERCRRSLANHLKPTWGRSYLSSDGVLFFRSKDGGELEINALYSTFNETSTLWWYSVKNDYWGDWQDNRHLAFLMRDADGVNYLILNPRESHTLLKNCGQGQDEDKNIHIRRPAHMGQEYFVEWQDLRLVGRIMPLPILEKYRQKASPWQPCPECGVLIKPADFESHMLRHKG